MKYLYFITVLCFIANPIFCQSIDNKILFNHKSVTNDFTLLTNGIIEFADRVFQEDNLKSLISVIILPSDANFESVRRDMRLFLRKRPDLKVYEAWKIDEQQGFYSMGLMTSIEDIGILHRIALKKDNKLWIVTVGK